MLTRGCVTRTDGAQARAQIIISARAVVTENLCHTAFENKQSQQADLKILHFCVSA
jgi:hypothetical protein